MERGLTPPTNQELLRLASQANYCGSELEGARSFLVREMARRGLIDTTGFYDASQDTYDNPPEAPQEWAVSPRGQE